MAKEIDQKKLDKLVSYVKKEGFGNYSETDCVNATGIERGQIARYLYPAELKAFPEKKVAATGKAIAKARKDGLRWPRIAVFAGISESKAKEMYESETGESAASSYTGRGRKWDPNATSVSGGTSGRRGGSGSAGKASSKKTAAASSGRRKTATAGSASSKKTAAAGRKPGRRTTRAGAAADPS